MAGIGTGYDLSCSTYSPDGKIFQIDYAGKAVENSGTAVGVRCKDGLVLGVEKLVLSKMLEPGSSRRIYSIDRHIGLVFSGMTSDARALVNRARQEARQYKSFYRDPIPAQVFADRLAGFMQAYTLYANVRPFGVSVIAATWDKDGPRLHMMEPSGLCFGYYATAAGKARQAAKNELEKIKFGELTCRQALFEVAKIINLVHDEVKDKEFELELSWISPETNYQHVLVPDDLLKQVDKAAKDAIEAEATKE